MRKRNIVLALTLCLLSATVGWESYVLATPAPTTNLVCEPGSCNSKSVTCANNIWLDGTTPVDSRPGQSQIVGTAGQDMGAFLNAITTVANSYCFAAGNFVLSTPWVVASNDTIQGMGKATVFMPGANSMNVIQVPSAGLATNPWTWRLQIYSFGMDSNGFTSVVGLNLNQSINENDVGHLVDSIYFTGTGWTYAIIADGDEASKIGNIFFDTSASNTGDISAKVYTGDIWLDHIDYGGIGGSTAAIHVMGQFVRISQSIINQVIVEHMVGSQTGSGGTDHSTTSTLVIEDTYMCNSDPSGISRLISHDGQSHTIFTLTFRNDYLCGGAGVPLVAAHAANSGIAIDTLQVVGSTVYLGNLALISEPFAGSTLTIQRLDMRDDYLSGNTPTKWFYTNGATGAITIAQFHWRNNFINGVPTKGDYIGQGNGNYYFNGSEPEGFWQTAPAYASGTPAVPGGTGSGNSITDVWGWPVNIYANVTKAAGTILVTGPHIIDINGVDKAVLTSPDTITLNPGEKIYFATAVPYAWQWYGSSW